MWIIQFLKVGLQRITLDIIDPTILEIPLYDHLILCSTFIFRVKFMNESNVMCFIYYMYIEK